MSNIENLSPQYVNSILHDLAMNFWLERGDATKFKVYNVGRDYLRDKTEHFHAGQTLDDVVSTVAELLKRYRVVDELQHTLQERVLLDNAQQYGQVRVLELRMGGCVHHATELKLAERGVPPFVCPVLNIISHALLQNHQVISELASIKVCDQESCRVQVVLFDEKAE